MRVLAVQVLLLAAGGLWAVVRTCLMVINLSVLDPCLGSWEDPGGSHPGSFEAQSEDPIWSDPAGLCPSAVEVEWPRKGLQLAAGSAQWHSVAELTCLSFL